jgi:hypothetical protein
MSARADAAGLNSASGSSFANAAPLTVESNSPARRFLIRAFRGAFPNMTRWKIA